MPHFQIKTQIGQDGLVVTPTEGSACQKGQQLGHKPIFRRGQGSEWVHENPFLQCSECYEV